MFEDMNFPPASGNGNGAESESEGATDWKAALRADFEAWLATIGETPEEEVEETADLPDLYSFYEQLAVANAENRKANRRTVEAFSQWAETLTRFESQLAPLRESTAQLAAVQANAGDMSRAHCLVLVELLDRLHRLADAFQSKPERKSWWRGNDSAWRDAWERQRQGFSILVGHFEELLKKEGVTRLETIGKTFNPLLMAAVAVEADPSRPAQVVIEEVAAGYLRRGELLRPAQVKVNGGTATT